MESPEPATITAIITAISAATSLGTGAAGLFSGGGKSAAPQMPGLPPVPRGTSTADLIARGATTPSLFGIDPGFHFGLSGQGSTGPTPGVGSTLSTPLPQAWDEFSSALSGFGGGA